MVILQKATYIHQDKTVLFQDIDFVINKSEKIALIGNNGSGKSTLLKVIRGELPLNSGTIHLDTKPYYIPQLLDENQKNWTVAEGLGISKKLEAFQQIIAGNTDEVFFDILNDDWTIEERYKQALQYWKLDNIDINDSLANLSGGERTKVFLAGILIHDPELILMDEPSNHLDLDGRQLLYDFIEQTNKTILLVSHDRKLLDLIDHIAELSSKGITKYGGNYSFYHDQKELASNALQQSIHSLSKDLKKAKLKERESLERQQKLNARGKGKQEKAGVPKIMMNTLKNAAEASSSKLKSVHQDKISSIKEDLQDSRSKVPDLDKIQFDFPPSNIHFGKRLIEAEHINFNYGNTDLWKNPLSFQIKHGERIAIKGKNGSGKTTLINLLLNKIEPSTGSLISSNFSSLYIDQEYSIIDSKLSIYEMAQSFNDAGLNEHEIKIRLSRFLFGKDVWNKSCFALSGGERLRLLLCCMLISKQSPDIIFLDEPSNNIDIQNLEILIKAIRAYKGTVIVISHDETFLDEIGIERYLELG